MKLQNLKISVRIGLLSALFLLALLFMAASAWQALANSRTQADAALARADLMTEAVDRARTAQVQFKTQVQEWKDLLLRGGDPANFTKYSDAFKSRSAATDAALADLDGLLGKLGIDRTLVEQARATHRQLDVQYLDALGHFDPAQADSYKVVDALVKGQDRAPTRAIDAIVDMIGERTHALQQIEANERARDVQHARAVGLATLFGAAIVTLAGTLWLARSITEPLGDAIAIAGRVADGDLATRIDVVHRDEVGVLLGSLKHMSGSLAAIVGHVRNGADAIASASSEIAQGNQDLAARTEQQAAAVEETAATMALIVRPGHPLSGRRDLRLADLAQAHWALSNPSAPARSPLDASFLAQGLAPPRSAVETSDLAILRGLLLNSDMITALSPSQFHYEIQAGQLAVLDLALPETTKVIGITRRADSEPSPGAAALMTEVRRHAGLLAATLP